MINYFIINPNQVRAYNIPVHNNSIDAIVFGVEADKAFILLTSRGKVMRFESQVPTEW